MHISYAFKYEFSFAFISSKICCAPTSRFWTSYILLPTSVVILVLSSIFTINAFSFSFVCAIFGIVNAIGVIFWSLFPSKFCKIWFIFILFSATCITFIFVLSFWSLTIAYLDSKALGLYCFSTHKDSNSVSIALAKSFLLNKSDM